MLAPASVEQEDRCTPNGATPVFFNADVDKHNPIGKILALSVMA